MNKLLGSISFSLIKVSIFFTVVLMSCRHEESTNTASLIANQSGHSIKVMPYYLGEISSEDVKEIPPKSIVEVLSNSNRGKGAGLSYPIYLIPLDSVVIVYGGIVTSLYYRQNSLGTNTKAILYSSTRSIYNENNYTRRILSESKHSISNEYTFVFTEQDYLDAKNK